MEFYKEITFKETPIGKIPTQWSVIKLREVLQFKNGERPRISEDGNVPVFGANGIMGYTNDFLVDNDFSLIVGRVGASGEVHLGEGKIWVSDNAIYSKSYDRAKVHLKYLFYSLKHRKLSQFASKTTHPIITQTFLNNFSVGLPPLSEQEKIVEVLSVVDLAIQKTDEIIAKTERLKRGLMQTLLTKGIGHKEFKETPIGKIPKTWKVVRLGDVAKLESGGTPSRQKPEYWKNGTIPWVKSGELNDDILYDTEEKISIQGLKNSNAKIFPKGTLLIALYGRGTVSKTAILGINAATNQAVAAITPVNNSFDPKFMQQYLIFSRNRLLTQTVNPSSDVGRTNIYLGSLKLLKIVLPPINEQRKITEILSPINEKLKTERKKKERLEKIKRGLMELLLTGKVRVKVN